MDTQIIELSKDVWTDVTTGNKFGFFTNHTDQYILYREAKTQPAPTQDAGHRLNPGADKQFVLQGTSKIWAKAKKNLNNPARVVVTPGYNSLTSGGPQSRDFLSAVNQGLVEGHSMIYVVGRNTGVSTTHVPIWTPNIQQTYMQAAETLDIISSDTVNDISTGTGARTVKIIGLDTDFNYLEEIVTLGASPVTTINAFRRVNFVIVETVGTYSGSNLGTISVTGTSTTNLHGEIVPSASRSENTLYTVPAGKTGYLLKVSITVESGKTVTLHFHRRKGADIVAAPFTPNEHLHTWTGLAGVENEVFNANHILPEKTDVWFAGLVSSTTAAVQVDYDLLLVDNV